MGGVGATGVGREQERDGGRGTKGAREGENGFAWTNLVIMKQGLSAPGLIILPALCYMRKINSCVVNPLR